MRSRGIKATATLAVVTAVVVALAGCGRPGVEPVIWLPKTGQTVSYATGDDGDLQMGIDWPSPRFTDNSDGTITDNLTGLMWDQSGVTATNYWAEDLAAVAGLSLGGHNDWRVPNDVELRTLWNAGQVDLAAWLNSAGFDAVDTSSYYTSSTVAALTSYAWAPVLSNGTGYGAAKTVTQRLVIAVRGVSAGAAVQPARTGQTATYASGDDGDLEMGVAWPNPRFVDNEDGTVTDLLTGLVWEQDASRSATWGAALSDANTMTLAGYDDWRMPNVLELMSIVNVGQAASYTWLNANGFTGFQTGDYWTSTTYAPDTAYAWQVSFSDGDRPQSGTNKSDAAPTIAVRGPDATP